METEILKWAAAVIIGVLCIALGVTRNDKQRRKAYKEGMAVGYEAGKALGHQKAYKIAKSLPDCAYKEGYFVGVADSELEKEE